MKDVSEEWAKKIFTAITGGGFKNFDEARQVLVQLYIPDMSIPRDAISRATGMLKVHYSNKKEPA